MAVEVTLDRALIEKWGNDIHVSNYIMRELKAKGVPVTGALFPTGLQGGRLVIEFGMFDELVVRWEA